MTSKGQETNSQPPSAVPFEIWQTAGLTEHLGGIVATQRLLEGCLPLSGQFVLDLGCGTGYTACWLAEKTQARVVALDLSSSSLVEAEKRVRRLGLDDRVTLIQADAHALPFRSGSFDLVVSESVLVFCTAPQSLAEAHRLLRLGGRYAANELTLLGPPEAELLDLLEKLLGIHAYSEEQWRSLFTAAGFTHISSIVSRFSLREQFQSHLQVDGWRGYFSGLFKGLGNLRISRTFLNRRMLRAARRFMPMIGYGLYMGEK